MFEFQIGDIVKHINLVETYGFITNIVIFADRTWYAVFWFNGEYEEYEKFEEHDLVKVS